MTDFRTKYNTALLLGCTSRAGTRCEAKMLGEPCAMRKNHPTYGFYYANPEQGQSVSKPSLAGF
ncbi:MAG: hypothetical protein QMD09_06080, partial [Desulfatibacillaceae bacterium]|nr:hypothetical protein [Desulfatibacillaceae bacterium]